MFKTSYVIQKPCRRSISSINPAKIFTTNSLHVERYFLSFPYCLFMFDYDLKGKKYRVINFYFYLSDGKEIFVPPMTNLFSGSRNHLSQKRIFLIFCLIAFGLLVFLLIWIIM